VNLEKIRRARDLLTEILVDAGDEPNEIDAIIEKRREQRLDRLMRAARRVVFHWHDGGCANAVAELENIVGCPASEDEI
jgi:hypothetical protein